MSGSLERGLVRLEAGAPPPLRQRLVWLEEGDPIPEAEPGEQLIICHWTWGDEEDDAATVPAARTELNAWSKQS